jgi:hypothetical protein
MTGIQFIERDGTAKVLSALSKALNVRVDLLMRG